MGVAGSWPSIRGGLTDFTASWQGHLIPALELTSLKRVHMAPMKPDTLESSAGCGPCPASFSRSAACGMSSSTRSFSSCTQRRAPGHPERTPVYQRKRTHLPICLTHGEHACMLHAHSPLQTVRAPPPAAPCSPSLMQEADEWERSLHVDDVQVSRKVVRWGTPGSVSSPEIPSKGQRSLSGREGQCRRVHFLCISCRISVATLPL